MTSLLFLSIYQSCLWVSLKRRRRSEILQLLEILPLSQFLTLLWNSRNFDFFLPLQAEKCLRQILTRNLGILVFFLMFFRIFLSLKILSQSCSRLGKQLLLESSSFSGLYFPSGLCFSESQPDRGFSFDLPLNQPKKEVWSVFLSERSSYQLYKGDSPQKPTRDLQAVDYSSIAQFQGSFLEILQIDAWESLESNDF